MIIFECYLRVGPNNYDEVFALNAAWLCSIILTLINVRDFSTPRKFTRHKIDPLVTGRRLIGKILREIKLMWKTRTMKSCCYLHISHNTNDSSSTNSLFQVVKSLEVKQWESLQKFWRMTKDCERCTFYKFKIFLVSQTQAI